MCSEDIAIQVDGISKCYHIYDSPQDRLKQIIIPKVKKIIGSKPNQYYREFWALKNLSFSVKKGESVGIIGRNGSGKSTLLQLICGTLTPTTGSVATKGRIAALLELGSGFNPEFTGKENVYMNGAILGLQKKEIDLLFDEIAAFADIGDFMYQPVKTYSSGMYVRLAFAVQACISPDILIVDEALAVGDALFQKRCFQKIEQLTASGVTLFFVSHDQESVRTLTTKALLLDKGNVLAFGSSSEIILKYRKLLHQEETDYLVQLAQQQKKQRKVSLTSSEVITDGSNNEIQSRVGEMQFGSYETEIIDVKIYGSDEEEVSVFYPGDLQRISVRFKTNIEITHLNVAIRMRNKEGVKIYSWGTLNQDMRVLSGEICEPIFWEKTFKPGEIYQVWIEHKCPLGANFYEIQVSLSEEKTPYYGDQRMLHWLDEAAFFTVVLEQRGYFFGGISDIQAKAVF